jgi:predicted dinucleotide-binding enzyme
MVLDCGFFPGSAFHERREKIVVASDSHAAKNAAVVRLALPLPNSANRLAGGY